MRHLALIITTTLIFVLAFTACDVTDTGQTDIRERQLPRELSAQEKILVDGSNDFAFRLLHKLLEKEPDDSFFASPLSISTAFAMAMNGADGDTYDQMRDFFGHRGLTRDEINKAFLQLIVLLTTLDEQVRFDIANSVWYREGYPVLQEFLDVNKEYFDAEVRALDFGRPDAADIINAWISDKTEGLIEKMIDQIGPDVIMYLINAIYFNGDWTVQFDPDDTRDQPFTRSDGSKTEVPMMKVADNFRYHIDDEWIALDMWYGDAGFSFTALIPADASASGGLELLAHELTHARFESITSSLKSDTVQVYMPKFEIDYAVEDFPDDLKEMGLTLPFIGGAADFSRISDIEDLLITDVMHRAVIKLDEEGTEAAAVTVIEISRVSYDPNQRLTIRLDRPFLFFIRENTSNTILFMGKYDGT
ncbi:MAG: serpin family protein [Balneolaceae bacterium]|nr:MAG: serpin family protein [Balneolaceae bacterium]